jgi:hypothetical protein
MRVSAGWILAISFRRRSRARNSMARSVSEEARPARSGRFWFSPGDAGAFPSDGASLQVIGLKEWLLSIPD